MELTLVINPTMIVVALVAILAVMGLSLIIKLLTVKAVYKHVWPAVVKIYEGLFETIKSLFEHEED